MPEHENRPLGDVDHPGYGRIYHVTFEPGVFRSPFRSPLQTGDRITAGGITYQIFVMGPSKARDGIVLALNKIGKRGRPLKSAERPALVNDQGELRLAGWIR